MELDAKLADYEWRLHRLERELEALRREASAQPRPAPALPVPPPAPRPPRVPPKRRPQPVRRPPRFELSDLLGARALAWAGGIVTLLGIVFFFVLAVNRGWIGPTARVGLGATASLLVFVAGLELRRRYGQSHSALAAVGAGLAGGYTTLLCAAALYHLIPDPAALAVAAAIGATGLVTALLWRSELIAGIGLVGAALAPLAVATESGVTGLGTAFAGIVLTAIAVVAVRQGWRALLVAGTAAAWPQLAALLGDHAGHPHWWLLLLTGLYAVVLGGAATGWHLSWEGPIVRKTGLAYVTVAAYTAALGSTLFRTEPGRGWALLASAVAFSIPACGFFGRPRTRSLAAVFAAAALVLGAAAAATLLSGQNLAYVWAAEAAALAWLACRTREPRLQLWALGYLGLGLVHVATIDARPRQLFVANAHPARGIATVAALAAAAAVVGLRARLPVRRARNKAGLLGRLTTILTTGRRQSRVRLSALWGAAVVAAYGAALGTLRLCKPVGFDWGHVAVIGLWGAAGLAILAVALVRGSRHLEAGGMTWVGAVLLTVLAYDLPELAATPRSVAFLLAAGTALAASAAVQVLDRGRKVSLDCGAFTAVAYGLATAALLELAPSAHLQGAALLAPLAVAVALSAWAFDRGQRDFSTLQWIFALALAALAAERLLDGSYLVLVWAATGALAAVVGARVPEPRLRLGALALVGLAAGHALALEAPPTDLFVVQAHPAAGVPALLAVLAAALVALSVSKLPERASAIVWWSAGVLALYAASLTVLELVQVLSPAGRETDFQRGHSAVSALWGLCGLALLYAGLTRRPTLRLAGFALFGISLAKIFFYDLPALSSITRALSFLAVGAVLLLGGFFYQRLLDSNPKAADKPPSGAEPMSPRQ